MLRKFRIKINDKEYMVEMEELVGEDTTYETRPVENTVPTPMPQAPPTQEKRVPQEKAAPKPPPSGSGEPVIAPMPGTILDVRVKEGEQVVENQVVAILEAMKMENEIVAPKAGTITAVLATKGAPIDVGKPIVMIE